MATRPNPAVNSMAEKAYYRLQAGDAISHCMEYESTDPIHEMIQDMVVAGPKSLDALREILDEAMKRKTQVYDDLNQVTNQLSIILKGYGINMEVHGGNHILQSLSENQLLGMMDEQNVIEPESRTGCLQVMKDSKELINTLGGKIQLLESIEMYLQDWLWGLTYQFIRLGEGDVGSRLMKDEPL
jgi:hypothetical protein